MPFCERLRKEVFRIDNDFVNESSCNLRRFLTRLQRKLRERALSFRQINSTCLKIRKRR